MDSIEIAFGEMYSRLRIRDRSNSFDDAFLDGRNRAKERTRERESERERE